MTKWKFKIDVRVDESKKRELQKKHYIIKEPFADVSIHEMHIPEVVEDLVEMGLEITISSANKQISCSMV